MNKYINEYVRIINSITLDENTKDEIFSRITDNSVRNKFDSKKQLVFASVAMVAVIVGLKAFAKNNQIR